MPVVPFTSRAPMGQDQSQGQAQPIPDQTYLMMAASQMHGEGRLIQVAASSNMFLDRNNQWVKQDASAPYNTQLEPHEEISFRQWVAANKVPFDPNAAVSDYDMRGFYKALVAGDEKAKSAIDTNDSRIHYPDFWKTPYHETFSAESQWADPAKAPSWNEKDQLVMPDGTVVYDDRAPKKKEQ